ncbi:MAG: hypothetical protein JO359_08660 [Candidatus Eremiobacteraeota bacterium]|nr:hypothetical protein [Candidatus Eremiobacteraeota bacterium]
MKSHEPVRELLRKLRKPHALARDPLAQALQRALRAPTPAAAVRQVVDDALRGFDERIGASIRRCELDGQKALAAALEAHVCTRQFYRYRATAFAAIGQRIEAVLSTHVCAEPPTSPSRLDAAILCSEAREAWRKRTLGGLQAALEAYERCAREYPRYAPAHVGVADAYLNLAGYCLVAPGPAFTRADDALRRALALDEGCAGAYASRADLAFFANDRTGAAAALEHALRLDPTLAAAYNNTAWHAILGGDPQAAFGCVARLLEAEPGIVEHRIVFAIALANLGRRGEAIAILERIVAAHPESDLARYRLGVVQIQAGAYADGLANLGRIEPAAYGEFLIAYLAVGEVGLGERDAAEARLNALRRASSERYVSPFCVALVESALRRYDAVGISLRRVAREDPVSVWFVGSDPCFDEARKRGAIPAKAC